MTRLRLLLLLVLAAGCEGSISGLIPPHTGGGGGNGTIDVDPCEAGPNVAVEPLRRLSHTEWVNTVSDLFGNPAVGALAAQQAEGFTPDPTSLGFHNSATFLQVKNVLLQQYLDASEQLAAEAVKDLPSFVPCTPANAGEEAACASQFIATFGRKAYRHTLTAQQQQDLEAVYTKARDAGYDFTAGVEWVTNAVLLSPEFLYRVEAEDGSGALRAVEPMELATRLSYLIWRSAPDEALLAAAEQGRLVTAADVEREARRMLQDPKSERLIGFFEEWFDTDEISLMTRDPNTYPGLDPSLPALFREEVRTTVKQMVFNGTAKYPDLLTTDATYVNGALAQHYGLAGVSGAGWQRVGLPQGRRGVFMSGGILTGHDKQTRTSIVARGIKVRTQLLCQTVPAPPNNVPALGVVDQTVSQSDRLAQHRADPACAGCHNLLDPLGQTFENLDAVGRVRTVDETGHTVSTAGEVTNTSDTEGPVASGADLLARFAQSREVSDCLVTQLFRYSTGRIEEVDQAAPLDACSVHTLKNRFAETGGDVKDLVVAFTQTDAFLLRRQDTQ